MIITKSCDKGGSLQTIKLIFFSYNKADDDYGNKRTCRVEEHIGEMAASAIGEKLMKLICTGI